MKCDPAWDTLTLLPSPLPDEGQATPEGFQAKGITRLPERREATGRTIHMHVARFLPSLIRTGMWPEPTPCQHSYLPSPRPGSLCTACCRLRAHKQHKPAFRAEHSSLAVLHKEKKIMLNILFMEEKIAAQNCHIVWSIFIFIPEPWK